MTRHYPDLGRGFWLAEANFPRGTTNQKHYPDLGSTRHQYGISALVSQTSFRRETSGGVAKLACVAGVSVRFRSKERGTRNARKMAQVKERGRGGEERKETSFTSPSPLCHFFALISFLARQPRPQGFSLKKWAPFLGFSLLRNQTETLATQAIAKCGLISQASSVVEMGFFYWWKSYNWLVKLHLISAKRGL